jgi:hypothetical protein
MMINNDHKLHRIHRIRSILVIQPRRSSTAAGIVQTTLGTRIAEGTPEAYLTIRRGSQARTTQPAQAYPRPQQDSVQE